MKHLVTTVFAIFTMLLIHGCQVDVPSTKDTLFDQYGTLEWHGSPAVDGLGMLLVIDESQYGAPGEPTDYPSLFTSDTTYTVKVIASYVITGELSTRGWGNSFPEIEIIEIDRQ